MGARRPVRGGIRGAGRLVPMGCHGARRFFGLLAAASMAGYVAVMAALASPQERTLADLPPSARAGLDLRLHKQSTDIPSSPFATLTSFEVHGEAEDASVVRTMRDLGVKWVMMHNIHGSLADPNDRRLNAWLKLCADAKIGVRCILVSRDRELWRKAIQNYGDRIVSFGYLNEPNAPTGDDHARPQVRPEAYAAELKEVARDVKATRPSVKLFAPELAMLQSMEERPYPWLRLAIEAGMLEAADCVSIHPYRQSYSPSNVPENPSTFEGRQTDRYHTYEEQVGTLRRLVHGKPVAVTEVGWSTAPVGPLNGMTRERITELTQAKYALRQQIMDFALGMEVAVYFLLRERHENAPFPYGHIENHFGIVHVDNSPKPAYTALQTLYSQLDSRSHLNTRVQVRFSQPGVKWYLFDERGSRIPTRRLVYWLPVPARDDFAPLLTEAVVGEVRVASIPLSDAPRILSIHRIGGRWGYPALIDLLTQKVDTAVPWAPN